MNLNSDCGENGSGTWERCAKRILNKSEQKPPYGRALPYVRGTPGHKELCHRFHWG